MSQPAQTSQSTLQACESLIREHRATEVKLDSLEALLNGVDVNVTLPPDTAAAIQEILAILHAELNTHFACEEQALFPAAEKYHPMVLMEVEHEQLLELRTQMEDLFAQAVQAVEAVAPLRETGLQFIEELRNHIVREDAGIFPTCERSLNDLEKAEVIAGMDRIRAAAQVTPTPTIQREPRHFKTFQFQDGANYDRAVMVSQLGEEGPMKIKQMTIQAGESLPDHWSPKAVMVYCVSGSGVFKANHQEQPLMPGTGILITPQLNHAIEARTTCQLLLVMADSFDH